MRFEPILTLRDYIYQFKSITRNKILIFKRDQYIIKQQKLFVLSFYTSLLDQKLFKNLSVYNKVNFKKVYELLKFDLWLLLPRLYNPLKLAHSFQTHCRKIKHFDGFPKLLPLDFDSLPL